MLLDTSLTVSQLIADIDGYSKLSIRNLESRHTNMPEHTRHHYPPVAATALSTQSPRRHGHRQANVSTRRGRRQPNKKMLDCDERNSYGEII